MLTSQYNHPIEEFDAIVVGAGFSGMYMLHKLRQEGYSVKVYDIAEDVGGVWYWNRYPGARCDSESIYYNYTFSEELYKGWTWSSRYATQGEILNYLNYVADQLDLRRDIQFKTRVNVARYDEQIDKWIIQLDDGSTKIAKYFISGVGCLSAANVPKIKGLNNYKGEWYHTGNWPHEGVHFEGKRVGVIGTGSSGIQSIPVIAEVAEKVVVFQRTPQFSIPARNHDYDEDFIVKVKTRFKEIREQMRNSLSGLPIPRGTKSALDDTPEARQKKFEEAWAKGGQYISNTYNDLTINPKSNETVSEFVRSKIKEQIKDPNVAQKLLPTYYFGTKRPVLDTNYYQTYNRENVTLVDVKNDPIVEITESGVRTQNDEYDVDMLVFATGYDAMIGALMKINIIGRNGVTLKERWDNGAQVQTYLGLSVDGFPNMFMITGPESPSVLSNVPISIEQHVEWITDCLLYCREQNVQTIEANSESVEEWSKHCREVAERTLFVQTASWYTGANIDGKPQSFPIYLGGVAPYRKICDEIATNNYRGYKLNRYSENLI